MMNESLSIFLVDDEVRAIKCVFDSNLKEYTYKTTDKTIQVNDLVLVKVGDDYKVVKTIEVDVQDQLNFESTRTYNWVVQKINTSDYELQLERERQLSKDINKLIFNNKREQMKNALKESGIDLKLLTK
jgi:hypothetical protein